MEHRSRCSHWPLPDTQEGWFCQNAKGLPNISARKPLQLGCLKQPVCRISYA
jgi:hypothetical protein